MDKKFQKELLEKLNNKPCDCREILLKYKNLGMTQHNMYKSMFKVMVELRIRGDEATEDDLMDLMDCIVGFCSSTSAIFEKHYTPRKSEQAEIDLIVEEVNSIK